MSEYVFETTWRIDAPLADVWEEVFHSEKWPQWWKGVVQVERLKIGDERGIGAIRRFTFKSFLPYALSMNIRSTRIEHHRLIEGAISGELEGTGTWRLAEQDGVTEVSFEERVRTTKFWMRLLAPLARRAFRFNHHIVMRWGGESLAKRLGATLLSCEEK